MKFTLSWLCDHLETEVSLGSIVDCLNKIGLEVEHVDNPVDTLSGFLTARIVSVVPHPNADRLKVCQVDIGNSVDTQVVCGAANARPGISVIFAGPGTYIPGTGVTLKKSRIRGIESAGMLCSEKELNLSEESAGIAELPPDTQAGQNYVKFLGLEDCVIDVSVTPNRGDALSVRGIARDVAAAGIGRLKDWRCPQIQEGFPSRIYWQNNVPTDCPWIMGRMIEGVKNGSAPLWIQRRLKMVGIRSISALVDISNYLTLDLGRPTHIFDADLITGDKLTIRRGMEESFLALNDKTYTASSDDIVIADEKSVQSLAGIMGGKTTGVTNDTVNVFLESALFDSVKVSLSGRRHNIISDARQRFERGIDQAFVPAGLDALTAMIQKYCGGRASSVVVAGREPLWERTASIAIDKFNTFVGMNIPATEIVSKLGALGFDIRSRTSEKIIVNIPPWRNDVANGNKLDAHPSLPIELSKKLSRDIDNIEGERDLIEEVLRLKGIDAVPTVSLPLKQPVPFPSLPVLETRCEIVRRSLGVSGLSETIGFSFVSSTQAAIFGNVSHNLQLLNPITTDLSHMRPTPLVSLVLAACRNVAKGFPDIGLFEIGPGFSENEQLLIVAGLNCGYHPRKPKFQLRQVVSVWDAKANSLTVLQALSVNITTGIQVTAGDAPPYYHPGRSGCLRQGKNVILGYFGELHPRVLKELDLNQPTVGFEVFIERIPAVRKQRKTTTSSFPNLQPIRRDFSFVVDQSVAAGHLLQAIRSADRNLIAGVSLFDVYTGHKIAKGNKSLSVEVVIQPKESNLTDADIEVLSTKIIAVANRITGAILR